MVPVPSVVAISRRRLDTVDIWVASCKKEERWNVAYALVLEVLKHVANRDLMRSCLGNELHNTSFSERKK